MLKLVSILFLVFIICVAQNHFTNASGNPHVISSKDFSVNSFVDTLKNEVTDKIKNVSGDLLQDFIIEEIKKRIMVKINEQIKMEGSIEKVIDYLIGFILNMLMDIFKKKLVKHIEFYFNVIPSINKIKKYSKKLHLYKVISLLVFMYFFIVTEPILTQAPSHLVRKQKDQNSRIVVNFELVVVSSPQPSLNRRFRHVKLACGVSKRVSFRHGCYKLSVIRCRLLDHVESTVMSRCYVACLAALVVHGKAQCNCSMLICVRVANVLLLFMMKMSFSTTWTYFVSFWCRIEYVVDEVQLNCQWYIKKCMH